jgi:hypothetical protein
MMHSRSERIDLRGVFLEPTICLTLMVIRVLSNGVFLPPPQFIALFDNLGIHDEGKLLFTAGWFYVRQVFLTLDLKVESLKFACSTLRITLFWELYLFLNLFTTNSSDKHEEA